MNPLSKRLAFLRRQVRFLDGWLGVCALVALVVGVFLTVGMLDFWLHIPSLLRAGLLVGLLVGSAYVAYRYLIRPFSKRCDDLNLALRIEEIYPELNDALATTVQFLNQSPEDHARVGGSSAMREKTVQATVEKAAACDFTRILDRRAAGLFGAAAICILLTTGLVVGMNRQFASTAFWRFVEPFGMHTWTRITVSRWVPPDLAEAENEWKQIDPKQPDKIAKGQPYKIKVNLEGQMPRKGEAKVEFRSETTKIEKMVPLKISPDRLSAEFETPIDMTLQYQTFKYRIVANDGSFPARDPWHRVEVVQEPKLVAPPVVTIYPPNYAELPQPKPLEGPGLVEVYAGSTVVLRAKADRQLEQAWIEYVPQQPGIKGASMLTILGQTDDLLQAVGLHFGGHAVWGKVEARFDSPQDRDSFNITFTPLVTGKYVLHLRDADKLSNQYATDLNVLLDPVPEVKLHSPTSTVTRALGKGIEVPFKFTVTDEHFAIRSVWVEYRRKIPATGGFEEPVRTVLYDDDAFTKLVPNLSARLGRAPFARVHPALGAFPMPIPDLRMRHKKLEVDMAWLLQDRFKVGDLVLIEICADDFCDIYPTREPGRSHAIELRIISDGTLIDEGRRELKEIIQQLKKTAKTEEKALGAVKETQKQEMSDQKVVDHFVENAETPQGQVHESVGKRSPDGTLSSDSLRHKVRALRKKLEDNKRTGIQVYRDAEMIQGVVDAIAQKELAQIDPRIAQAREELQKLDKISALTHKKLADTARLQDRVLKALNELIQKLEPQAKINEIAAKLQAINQKNKELAKELEQLNAEMQEHAKNPNNTEKELDIVRDKQKPKIDRIAQDQEALANQMEKVLQEMKDARKEYEANKDKANLDKLNEALMQAGQPEEKQPKIEPKQKEPKEPPPPINGQMRDLANQLKKDNEVKNKTIQKQKDVAKQLDKVIEAIEGKNDPGLKDQIAQRDEVNKKIDAHKKELDRLREEVKKADMIKDKEERLKKKQELAAEHAKLQEDIEKTRRELERLNEKEAAAKLQDAADKLDKAVQNLQNDANPEAQQQDARKDLNDAKKDIKEKQEELARELLVKLFDQLEGLKIREVASLERSETLHEKIMKRKSWTEAFLGTIEGNIDVQKGIAEETDTFKEKLKEAKVFHSLLEKAKGSMDSAVEVMSDRHKNGNDRRYLEMEDKKDMPADEVKDEQEAQATTVRHQKQAVKRLDTLLDSIKEEINRMDRDKRKREENPNPPKDNEGNEPKEKGGMKAQDGIPPNAQLKALRAEQLDLLERTKAFDARKLDLNKLTEPQQKELKELSDDQANIHRLFREIMPVQPAQPELKKDEGAPK